MGSTAFSAILLLSTLVLNASDDVELDLYYKLCQEDDSADSPSPLEEFRKTVDGRNLTFQVLHATPQVTKIVNFLSREETAHLIALGTPSLRLSTVFEKGRVTTNTYRTSQTSWLEDHLEDSMLAGISRRITEVTGLSPESAENFQIAFYSEENQGKYEPHLDWGVGHSVTRSFQYQSPAPRGRMATFLMYLDGTHGKTVFPRLSFGVRPDPGSALLFFNLLPNSEGDPLGDPLLKHGACPVLQGVKFIATRWIHERGNEGVLQPPSDAKVARLYRQWQNLSTSTLPVPSEELDEMLAAMESTSAGGDDSCFDT
eukprot:TRINITY_DN16780_c0_g1_i1.p1 TRINITY_DN16780_c0_g1~~TRINITY_DN16780_c0_g1_i1.p1  ORF type:complete len:314 (+),score=47.73 TRINITY_DN16780_c0_g1_i1:36-977(+)